MTQTHWFTSGVAFTLIMHIIVLKLFIETVYWNWLMGITNLLCLLFYYICVLGGNTAPVAEIFQPEINGVYFMIVSSGKAWVVLLVLPIVALLPDATYVLCQKIFFPTPTDAVMLRQMRQPDFFFDGFSEVFIPQLKGSDEDERERMLLEKRHPLHLARQGSSETEMGRPGGGPYGSAADPHNESLSRLTMHTKQ